MRIRKRPVPFQLSSDPLLPVSPLVQLHSSPTQNLSSPQDDKVSHIQPQPSDQQNQSLSPIGHGTDGLKCLMPIRQREESVAKDERERREEGEKGSNHTRKGSIPGVESVSWVHPESSVASSYAAARKWGEGEKAFPLKKRRGSFEKEYTIIDEKDKKEKCVMKTKMNKKCVQVQQNNNAEKEEEEGGEGTRKSSNVGKGGAKRRGRGGALMEGSRCSRVNGRGWRCCQPTLVGYSLCEHHLGKGRLRSMNTVRSRSLGSSNAALKNNESQPSSTKTKHTEKDPLGDDNGDEREEEKPLMITKKRMKLGMVKARSISSLLGQTNNAIELDDNNDDQAKIE